VNVSAVFPVFTKQGIECAEGQMKRRRLLVPVGFVSLCSLLLAGCAGGAPGYATVSGDAVDRSGAEALGVSNPSLRSNRNYTLNPDISETDGAFGGAVGPSGTSSETFPPGETGAEAPGSAASGSSVGQAGP
jgi:outer membrane lipoprotein SlyB